MFLDQHPDLLERVGKAMARSAHGDWTSITLAVTVVRSMSQSEMSIESADGGVDESQGLTDEGDLAYEALREAMYQPGKGSWYNARFTLHPDGKLVSEFDYDNPPFEGDADEALLIDDQERFPRDPENLPSWHPSRSSV
jgi:hypothetical protein